MAMTQRSARDLVADITTATEEGDYEAAVRAATWGVESFPDAAVFHRLRGAALMALGANAEAKADLTQALTVDPLDHEALVTLSRLEEAEGDLYTAAEHLLTAWEHDPANGVLRSDLTYRLARLYGSEGYLQYTRPALAALYVRNAYPERAAREYAAALAEQPTRADLRLASVLARWRLGALTEATDGCVHLLAEQPHLVRARWALADALARRGKGEEGREHAKHAASLDPDGAIARALIEGNPDATIVDPDEMVRVPLDSAPATSSADAPPPEVRLESVPASFASGSFPSAADAGRNMPLHTTAAGIDTNGVTREPVPIRAFADDDFHAAATEAPEEMAIAPFDTHAGEPTERADVDAAETTAAASATAEIPPGTDVVMAAPREEAPIAPAASVPPEPAEEPEEIIVVTTPHEGLALTYPGGEPLLDPTDRLAEVSDAGTLVAAPEPAAPSEPAGVPAPGSLTTAMQARIVADDLPGAVALGRSALAAAGKDPAQVRPLLPAMRALVEAAPNRPDARRLLGDTYRRLGQMAQAQGQYQQALLVRVAGKRQ